MFTASSSIHHFTFFNCYYTLDHLSPLFFFLLRFILITLWRHAPRSLYHSLLAGGQLLSLASGNSEDTGGKSHRKCTKPRKRQQPLFAAWNTYAMVHRQVEGSGVVILPRGQQVNYQSKVPRQFWVQAPWTIYSLRLLLSMCHCTSYPFLLF